RASARARAAACAARLLRRRSRGEDPLEFAQHGRVDLALHGAEVVEELLLRARARDHGRDALVAQAEGERELRTAGAPLLGHRRELLRLREVLGSEVAADELVV